LGAGLKPTSQQLEALSRLRGSPDFEKHQEVSREYERELTERLVRATDVAMIHQTQGAITALRALRGFFEEAPASIQKMSGK
jgi:hypothetical protein